ncbi:MAG: helix-turn-helix transcriptional regulator [Bacteroidia bacterium]
MNNDFRCDCPITSALDVLGDKWMLVIVKLMLLDGKDTFKAFSESDEAVASGILAAKLKMLEKAEIISKNKLPDNKKANIYLLTEKGLALAPVIAELARWSDGYLREANPIMQNGEAMAFIRNDPKAFSNFLVSNYKEKLKKIKLA